MSVDYLVRVWGGSNKTARFSPILRSICTQYFLIFLPSSKYSKWLNMYHTYDNKHKTTKTCTQTVDVKLPN